jgi:hypothetical protein
VTLECTPIHIDLVAQKGRKSEAGKREDCLVNYYNMMICGAELLYKGSLHEVSAVQGFTIERPWNSQIS